MDNIYRLLLVKNTDPIWGCRTNKVLHKGCLETCRLFAPIWRYVAFKDARVDLLIQKRINIVKWETVEKK